MKKTKMICTIGPACDSDEILIQMLKAGMNVARLNFSHESLEIHKKRMDQLRRLAKKLNQPLAILGDLQGPKIRIGKFINGKIELKKGDKFTLTARNIEGDEKQVSISYKNLPKELEPGHLLLLDDGKMQLKVLQCKDQDIFTEVLTSGALSNRKGLNIPDTALSIPSLTEKDRMDLDFMIKQKADYIALSFVQTAQDVIALRQIIDKKKSDAKIIAKLEKPLAIKNLDEILNVSDGVMVARGDLGVEMSPEKVPAIQKRIIQRANELGKPVITATQMLESMTQNPSPTRAEASDVANAIFDGTDAVMLSGETASGLYPVLSAETMCKIICEAEEHPAFIRRVEPSSELKTYEDSSIPNVIAHASWLASQNLSLKWLVVFSSTGRSALLLSKYRPNTKIIAGTHSPATYRRMNLYWGLTPMMMPPESNTEKLIAKMNRILLKQKKVKKGDLVGIVSGSPVRKRGATNLLKIHVID